MKNKQEKEEFKHFFKTLVEHGTYNQDKAVDLLQRLERKRGRQPGFKLNKEVA